ncbi:MAG: glycosyltransferase, MGT [Candidatus Peregrinibacteria bacterium Greene1014_49]|nr:MAG: glycosyltransferase, MGT [Candidatus Peregrinibacteria bacterium Greene1014_49]
MKKSLPIGSLKVTASSRGVTAVTPGSRKRSRSQTSLERRCERELQEYFAGTREHFTVPLDLQGTTFQKSVWEALRSVPHGTTLTYGQLARKIGSPRAVRAVASAVARNPIGVIIPCHRIIPLHGSQPGNFAWGKKRKVWLIKHEQKGD